MLVVGGLMSPAAYALAGWLGLEGLAYSVGLCLVPGLLTVVMSDLLKNTGLSPYVVLLGGALRMAFVLVGLLVVSSIRLDLGFRQFTVWLLASYLVALAIETALILAPAKCDAAISSQN
jgi:hypothetical protein